MLYVSMAAWAALAFFTVKPALRVLAGRGVDHDPLFLSFFLTGVVMELFSARWIIAPDSMALLNTVRAIGTALALFKIMLWRFYGRPS